MTHALHEGPRMGPHRRRHRHDRHHRLRRRAARRRRLRRAAGGRQDGRRRATSAAVVESVKAASEVYAPISGEVAEINGALDDKPAHGQRGSPRAGGWFMKLKLTEQGEADGLDGRGSLRGLPGDPLMAGHGYTATVAWRRGDGEDFAKGRYSRGHVWRFDGGIEVPASASPSRRPGALVARGRGRSRGGLRRRALELPHADLPRSRAPRRLRRRILRGRGGRNDGAGRARPHGDHRAWSLRPRIAYATDAPDQATLDDLHHKAHEDCFIANSVKTEIAIEAPASVLREPMRYLPHTPDDRDRHARDDRRDSIDDLFADIPAGKRLKTPPRPADAQERARGRAHPRAAWRAKNHRRRRRCRSSSAPAPTGTMSRRASTTSSSAPSSSPPTRPTSPRSRRARCNISSSSRPRSPA